MKSYKYLIGVVLAVITIALPSAVAQPTNVSPPAGVPSNVEVGYVEADASVLTGRIAGRQRFHGDPTVSGDQNFVSVTNTPSFGDDIPGLNVLPEKWRGLFLIALFLSPFITRGLYAVRNGGGIKGFFNSIWLGTNTPPKPPLPDA